MTRLKRSSKKEQRVDLNSLGDLVISSVITTLDLDAEDRDFVNGELKWLFSAADNLMQIILEQADRDQPVARPIPPEAQKLPEANNQLLKIPNDYRYIESEGFEVMLRGESPAIKGGWYRDLDSLLKRINVYLENLNLLLDREATLGEAAKSNVALQSQIRGARIDIVEVLEDMAELMNSAYGILVTSPGQLMEYMEETT